MRKHKKGGEKPKKQNLLKMEFIKLSIELTKHDYLLFIVFKVLLLIDKKTGITNKYNFYVKNVEYLRG